MGLEDYRKKRDFARTPEPSGSAGKGEPALRFVVHKHAASHLHYDLRLELDGVLKSWAVPKGPSLDPAVKRLAMMVEDHPYDYKDFEGVIPPGNYGAGNVIIWDEGACHAYGSEERAASEQAFRQGLEKGDLKFVLNGHKLKGQFALVRIRSDDNRSWLLIKKHDQFAGDGDITRYDRSVVSGKTIEEVGLAAAPERIAAPESPMPHRLRPMLATLVDRPFDDPRWIFEIKLDGYRAIAEVDAKRVLLYSRNNLSFNAKFPAIVHSLQRVGRQAVLDGELVILDDRGRSSFQALQNHNRTGEGAADYFVFDLLYLDGKDLRPLPLSDRKELLRQILPELPRVHYCDHVAEKGTEFFSLAQENGLEGIVAKLADSRYQTGKRSRDWLKIKVSLQQEAIICGFTAPKGSRRYFGTLVLGVFDGGELVHIGHSGGGFDDRSLKQIYEQLQPLVQDASPFRGKSVSNMPVTWVKPELVCEVAFAQWTDEGLMRQPVFLGLREDVAPASVVREIPAAAPVPSTAAAPERGEKEKSITIDGKRIKLTNLAKLFWPDEGYTKGDVVDYYRKVAPLILPYLRDRPESLYRTPNGITEPGFFHKDVRELPPHWVRTEEIYSESNDRMIRYLICQDEATLVYLANLGCIELNPWLSRIGSLDYPDYFVIDLDPEDIAFDRVVEAALAVREVLGKAGISGYPKTSGATGMHIYVPLQGAYDYSTATQFARIIATLSHQLAPQFTSIVRSPGKRQKKVYLDYLQNVKGQTLAAPYSIRPRPGATVSTPLSWDEVKTGLDPRQFTIANVQERFGKRGDLFKGVLGPGIDIAVCLENLEQR